MHIFVFVGELLLQKTWKCFHDSMGNKNLRYKIFKESRERVEDETRSDRSSTSNNEHCVTQDKDLVFNNH